MNPNYMNYFDPSAGHMPMGNAYGNQPAFSNMPTGGSFVDMINGASMMPPEHSPVPRFNPYAGMYGALPYGMENSAARLQQFARHVTPRPNSYNLPGQNMSNPMALYNVHQEQYRMRMKQLPNYDPRHYNEPPVSPWSRMSSGMPHLQQHTPSRNTLEVLQSSVHNTVQSIPTPDNPSTPFRKMPVLDEAPPIIRGQSPLLQHGQSQHQTNYESSFMNNLFSENSSNIGSPSYNHSPGQRLTLNLTNDGLNLPGMSFPSPHQQHQQIAQGQNNSGFGIATDLYNNFGSSLNSVPPSPKLNMSIPQSPKLTHFGPSTPSSVTSFDQPNNSFDSSIGATTTTPSVVSSTPMLTTSTTSIFMSTSTCSNFPSKPSPSSSLSLAATAKTKFDGQLKSVANQGLPPPHVKRLHPYLIQMEQIQQQIAKLKQLPHSPHVLEGINTLAQRYQLLHRECELVSQNISNQNNSRSIPMHPQIQHQPQLLQQYQSQQSMPPLRPQMSQPSQEMHQHPTISTLPLPTSSEDTIQSSSDMLDDSLMSDNLNIPDLDNYESKDEFLNDNSKNDSLFQSEFLTGSLLFAGDSLNEDKVNDKKKMAIKRVTSHSRTNTNSETIDQKKPVQFNQGTIDATTAAQQKILAQHQQIKPKPSVDTTTKSVPIVSQSLSQTMYQSNMVQYFQHLQPLQSINKAEISRLPQLRPTKPTDLHTYQRLQPINQSDEQSYLPFPFHHPQFSSPQMMQQNMMSVSDLISSSSSALTSSISSGINTMSNYSGLSVSLPGSSLPGGFHPAQQYLPIQSMDGVAEQEKIKHGRGRGSRAGRGSRGGRGGKGLGRGRAGRPPGSLNKKKKEEKEKHFEVDNEDFDQFPPNKRLVDHEVDPEVKRKLRDTKRKNYKDDYNYNFSEDEDRKSDEANVDEQKDVKVAIEPVISGGANALVAYRPDLEAEGEIAVIEKILAMRTVQSDGPVVDGEEQKMVEEFFVKYKGYSYLHCEWGTIDQLAKKDKRVHLKVKRYLQKRDQTYAFLNELDDEPFNPDYLEIDRVLDMQTTTDPVTNEMFNHYLVKWRALPYEESTWELQMNIDETIIKQFHELKNPPPAELRRFLPRPHETEWRPYTESPVYKNNNKLHEYQLEGLNWLTFCWYKRINCILADEMGLGKTIQSISLLCAMKQYGICGPFLVIAPLSTIANWQREFEDWSDINAIVYHGSTLSRNNIQQYEMFYKDEKGEFITSIYKFEAIITTYEMVLSANSFLCTIPFRCLIIDEAHRLKNQKCKLLEGLNNLRMEHRVLLTGTPLQNNVEELFSLLNFLEPARFPSQQVFLYEFGNLRTESQVEKLQEILKPMMLRRLKEDVATNIATKEETIVEVIIRIAEELYLKVELTTIQKKFYRAILEKNFTFLAKGNNYSNLPNLMNTMMELRKCCNHPFLIKGAEDRILLEYISSPDDPDKENKLLKAMIESSGKLVLIDKLLPKLKDGGHKVLIFSQMIKVLNIIEDYLVAKRYLFERIDGGVQGNMRQAAIDRFCRPDSDRFIFLLCTRAGGLGINLTAADTVIIFDSDWNPQNDLQAQARCHRIGQEKPVKVYRLICRNTYEREMFDRASLKLGLDKAVLQNMNAKDNSAGQPAMSKKEVEELLKKGAYGAVMETDEDANKFCEEDIDQILLRRTQIIQIQGEGKGSTFSKASFVSDKARQDINLDDPDFWKKWAKKASIDLEELEKDHELIVDEPRKRKQTKRFGNDGDPSVDMSDFESDDETYEPHKEKGKKSMGPVERATWTRVECFKVEKSLLTYGWSRWQEIISHAHFRQEVKDSDMEAISRTILAFCYRYYKGDDRTKTFFVELINESLSKSPPKNMKLDFSDQVLGSASPKNNRGRKTKGNGKNPLRRLTHQYSKPALVECNSDWLSVNPEQIIIDPGYRKHLQHHCSKIMSRVRFLHCLQFDIIKDSHGVIFEGKSYEQVSFKVPIAEKDSLPTIWWDAAADKSLLMGTYKHGYEKYRLIRSDTALCFYQRLGVLQSNEKVPGSPDSLNNPGSVERHDDVSDPEFTLSSKRKSRGKKGGDDDDFFTESDDDKDLFPMADSPASLASTKEVVMETKGSEIVEQSELRWPSTSDINLRLRRLIAAHMKLCDKEYLDVMKAEKDKQKQEKLAIIALERQKKKTELQQKWTKREEGDFYRVVSNFGVCYNRETKIYDWEKLKVAAKLDKKQNSTLTAYYNEFTAMCRKAMGMSTEEDTRKYKGSQIEEISEERASRCMQRIRVLSRIREQVLPHEKLDERLKLCQVSADFPRWWETGKHDKALLVGIAKHGLWRTEYHVLLDPELIFKEIVEKASKKKLKPEIKGEEEIVGKGKELAVNGEHVDGSSVLARKINSVSEDGDSHVSNDPRLPVINDVYAHVLASWPKDKAIVSHLEKVCQCVIKGEWPKPTRFDITPIIAKLPAATRPAVSTVGQMTHNQLTSEKAGLRGEEAASKDFKIKSIDGLKLTVKTEIKKRKRPEEEETFTSPLKTELQKVEELSGNNKKKVFDGVPMVEVAHRSSSSVQIHVPHSSPVKSSSQISSKPVIHFPVTVRVPRIASSIKVTVPTTTTSTITKVKVAVPPLRSSSEKIGLKESANEISRGESDSSNVQPTISTKSTDQAVGIHINSPNSNVRIVGSKIEVKEKPSIKREIDLSQFFLKVPDPSKFLPSKDHVSVIRDKQCSVKELPRKRSKVSTKVTVKPPTVSDKPTRCEHKKDAQVQSNIEPSRRRPERSAKTKAKDSISEITEAEHMPLPKDLLPRVVSREDERQLKSPQWMEVRSPSHNHNSRDYFCYDQYPPSSHYRHSSRSPPPLRRLSPDTHQNSPPLHSIHDRALPAIHQRHSQSPPLHDHSSRIRDIESEHINHLYTEPLSPRHRRRDDYYFSERSRSPIFYDYRMDKDIPYPELQRRSPLPYKRVPSSPGNDMLSSLHKHDTYPYVHLSDSLSPRSRRRDIHSPVLSEERFPYGRVIDYDASRYRYSEINSHSPRSVRSSPIEGYQYQPLSRLTPESKSSRMISPSESRKIRGLSPEPCEKHSKSFSRAVSREDSIHSHQDRTTAAILSNLDVKSGKRDPISVKVISGTIKNPPLSFYPVESSKTAQEHKKLKTPSENQSLVIQKANKNEPVVIGRSVIEIPEETVRKVGERRTSQKRKGIGLLEMKIQGLKKQKLNKSCESAVEDIIENTKVSVDDSAAMDTRISLMSVKSPKASKSISGIIENLSNVRTSVISPSTVKEDHPSEKKLKARTKKTLNLNAITKNLTDRATALSPPHEKVKSPLSPTFDKMSHFSQTFSQSTNAFCKSPSDLSAIRVIQRTPDPTLRNSCISPCEETSPLRRVTQVTTVTTDTVLSSSSCASPAASLTSVRCRKSLDELSKNQSTIDSLHRSNEKSQLEGKKSRGFLDRKVEELKEKSMKVVSSENIIKHQEQQPVLFTSSKCALLDNELERYDGPRCPVSSDPQSNRSSVISPVSIIDGPPKTFTGGKTEVTISENKSSNSNFMSTLPVRESVVSPNSAERLLDETAAEVVTAALINIRRGEKRENIYRFTDISANTPLRSVDNYISATTKTSSRSPPGENLKPV